MISYFTDDDACDEVRTVLLDLEGGAEKYELYLLDEKHDNESIGYVTNGSTLEIRPNTVLLLQSV